MEQGEKSFLSCQTSLGVSTLLRAGACPGAVAVGPQQRLGVDHSGPEGLDGEQGCDVEASTVMK